jgi:hypothetical protein
MSRQARESRAVSATFESPVPGIITAGSIPPSTSARTAAIRSSTPTDSASPVVPNGTSPAQPWSSKVFACATYRSVATVISPSNGVSSGTSTPRIGEYVMP